MCAIDLSESFPSTFSCMTISEFILLLLSNQVMNVRRFSIGNTYLCCNYFVHQTRQYFMKGHLWFIMIDYKNVNQAFIFSRKVFLSDGTIIIFILL